MSVLDKIDEFLQKPVDSKSKKVIKEDIAESNINQDIIDFLNSLDDDMLDVDQVELKNRILDANIFIDETDEDDLDDIEVSIDDIESVSDEDELVDMDDIDVEGEEIGLDDIIDEPDTFYESKKVKKTIKVQKKVKPTKKNK